MAAKQTEKEQKRKIPIRMLAMLAAVITCVVTVLFLLGLLGGSSFRVAREHGLKVPASAAHFICGGDARIGILDRGAASAFEMTEKDLPIFISQLKVRKEWAGVAGSIFPGNSQYQINIPWRAKATGLRTYQCASPNGDTLSVEVWQINQSKVGICLYTDWN